MIWQQCKKKENKKSQRSLQGLAFCMRFPPVASAVHELDLRYCLVTASTMSVGNWMYIIYMVRTVTLLWPLCCFFWLVSDLWHFFFHFFFLLTIGILLSFGEVQSNYLAADCLCVHSQLWWLNDLIEFHYFVLVFAKHVGEQEPTLLLHFVPMDSIKQLSGTKWRPTLVWVTSLKENKHRSLMLTLLIKETDMTLDRHQPMEDWF